MAGSVNKVIIIGNLGRDPETRTFPNGGKVCNLRIATSETWKDKDSGQKKERTEWHSVAIFSESLVRIAEQYLRKGSKVYIEGQLETRKWQGQDGKDNYATEIVLRPYKGELTLLDGTGERREASDADVDRAFESTARREVAKMKRDVFGGDLDQDIPFAPEVR